MGLQAFAGTTQQQVAALKAEYSPETVVLIRQVALDIITGLPAHTVPIVTNALVLAALAFCEAGPVAATALAATTKESTDAPV